MANYDDDATTELTESAPVATAASVGRKVDGLFATVGRQRLGGGPFAVQRWIWDRRAHSWEGHSGASLQRVVDAVLDAAGPCAGKAAADLGCGTGRLSLALAAGGATVTAVDLSPRMIERLEAKARRDGLGSSVVAKVVPIEQLALRPSSLDLVVSNYALHHLRDGDKEEVVRAVMTWLRPGGRLVVGDMMFGLGTTDRDRRIIGAKVAIMVRRGPGGWWRLAKNAVRLVLRLGERPVPMHTWVRYLEKAGLQDVTAQPVVAEAAVVTGTKP